MANIPNKLCITDKSITLWRFETPYGETLELQVSYQKSSRSVWMAPLLRGLLQNVSKALTNDMEPHPTFRSEGFKKTSLIDNKSKELDHLTDMINDSLRKLWHLMPVKKYKKHRLHFSVSLTDIHNVSVYKRTCIIVHVNSVNDIMKLIPQLNKELVFNNPITSVLQYS